MATFLLFGGASGSGGAVCRKLLAEGENVVMVDCCKAAALLARDCNDSKLPGTLVQINAAPEETGAADEALGICRKRFDTLDGVVVNLNRANSRPLEAWTAEAFDVELAFSLKAPFLIAQAAAASMSKANMGGSIVLTSSTAALRGSAGKAAFHAAKAGLVGLCQSLAAELASRRIRVNCILPGWIDSVFGRAGAPTDTIPLRRLGHVGEVADAIIYLMSAPSASLSGTALVVDGGATAI